MSGPTGGADLPGQSQSMGIHKHPLVPATTANVNNSKQPGPRPSTAPIRDISGVLPSFQPLTMNQIESQPCPPTSKSLSSSSHASLSSVEKQQSSHPEPDYDWASFIAAYAGGKWDPSMTPNPPKSAIQPPIAFGATTETPSASLPSANISPTNRSIPVDPSPKATIPTSSADPPISQSAPVTSSSGQGSRSISRQAAPSSLALPPYQFHRTRNSFSSGSSSSTPHDPPPLSATSPLINAERQTAAAALRLAGVRNSLLSPLALPSPEHELTDPMRGASAVIPGLYSSSDTGSSSKGSRFSHVWQEVKESSGLPTIEASPVGTPLHSPIPRQLLQSPIGMTGPSSVVPTSMSHFDASTWTSAPAVPVTPSHPPDSGSMSPPHDYFGPVRLPREEVPASGSLPELPGSSEPPGHSIPRHVRNRSTTDDGAMATASAPLTTRKQALARQSSAPLPHTNVDHEDFLPGGRRLADGASSSSRSLREDQVFHECGYLVPPNPPDELDRRRALYKFNIWNTPPDANFDRIIHLAKLVFNAKGALISLIDANEQWMKASAGIPSPTMERSQSICAHTILLRGDEPMIVLDTQKDWRFARHPMVLGGAKARFYAGSPLRTSDGFNIGTLAIFDDCPRTDFPPRQRYSLKEFAAIVMREMELWRDKIQLRIREKIQNSMEEFSRECLEVDITSADRPKEPLEVLSTSMDKIYNRAANLVRETLDIEGVLIMDVSQTEMEQVAADASVSIALHEVEGQVTRSVASRDYSQLLEFFTKYPQGKISESILPLCLRPFIPSQIQYALTVPIFNVDKRPFALLCTYNLPSQEKRYLEGHELSYLRAIGVIILSAVLKRRMLLADKAKSLFISNISHELRTPLHGILAAAELLNDTHLTTSQLSFLHTVQACGTSLVETVNHVLDFTKLSGNTKAGSNESSIAPTGVNLLELVEDAVDGCWIGFHARQAASSGAIGSVYAPPPNTRKDSGKWHHVEVVIDVPFRPLGWIFKCEKGGIRRILMNLFGNALKFTSDGFIQVSLKQVNNLPGQDPETARLELSVVDTGKGIKQHFLKNQLFHPFSQENPLQTGTGLGLAIVNSIVKSIGGTIDVSSEEGVGTEVKVAFPAYFPTSTSEVDTIDFDHFVWPEPSQPLKVSLEGFDDPHKGMSQLRRSVENYLTHWWGFEVTPEGGDIAILNDNVLSLQEATNNQDTQRPFLILSTSRGDRRFLEAVQEYERIGGFCRILHKPVGPSSLRFALGLCTHAFKISTHRPSTTGDDSEGGDISTHVLAHQSRRNSTDSNRGPVLPLRRPSMPSKSQTAPPMSSWKSFVTLGEEEVVSLDSSSAQDSDLDIPILDIGKDASIRKASVSTAPPEEGRPRILVIEDNEIIRGLLLRWLSNKGYAYCEAVDGQQGVSAFEEKGPFDVVLLDLSMPILDGVEATAEIRKIESSQEGRRPSRILALTGMSSVEDKARAFSAGVDGYLVKPVPFRTLEDIFRKLGLST